ncbi:hypothetical protein [Pleionea sp. CnH1-48]|uniref:hypothetical protein n=1 Tax=Pleionea sp. CnH1-48 TaxID=2954494 RepID=UPI002097CB1F|nr:hypothetical protein [Pleionea sp. CnH1-48]MCO7222946.1 hypothetical protein [Pleionea sp. CnH1-48]
MNSSTKPAVWFWIISVIALLWNLAGVAAFVVQMSMTPEQMAALPEAHQELYRVMPAWVTIAFAVAVFGGAIGSLLLLLKKSLAKMILIASLAGVLAQMTYNFFLSNTFEVMGKQAMTMPIVVIIIALALVGFSHMSTNKGWLN